MHQIRATGNIQGMVIVMLDEAFDWTGAIPAPTISYPSATEITSTFDDDQFVLVMEQAEPLTGVTVDITLTGMTGAVTMSK